MCIRDRINSIQKEELMEFTEKLVNCFERGLSTPLTRKQNKVLLFNQEEGIEPFFNVAIQSLVFGNKEQCKNAVRLYNVMIKYTDTEYLQSYSLKLIGPVIRVLNYKYELDIKSRILQLLVKFIEKQITLKTFAIQLQTTLIKLLNEFPESVNFIENVSQVLTHVMSLTIKKDLIFNENYVRFTKELQNEGNAYPSAFFMEKALEVHHNHISKALIEQIAKTIRDLEKLIQDGQLAFTYGKILGYFSIILGEKYGEKVFSEFTSAVEGAGKEKKYKVVMQLLGLIKVCQESIYMVKDDKIRDLIVSYIIEESEQEHLEDFIDACATFKETRGNRFQIIKKAVGTKKIMDSNKGEFIRRVQNFQDL
eukprot:TRINITY_DN553_c0_g1_i9.p1 TRINITY_DN553_c0_g1~~TRINITY_DN553_c0_g1_i9.p1  ORF type:complete len:365 (+),score=79.95 TRINITY_DN553_c0_g1_i9:65-1159(+)